MWEKNMMKRARGMEMECIWVVRGSLINVELCDLRPDYKRCCHLWMVAQHPGPSYSMSWVCLRVRRLCATGVQPIICG